MFASQRKAANLVPDAASGRAAMRGLAVCLCALLASCASRPAPPGAPVAPPPSGKPGGSIGLSARDLSGQFGTPSFVRKENGAEMWRYDSADCRAFFFLYSENDLRIVRHVETVPRGARTAADAKCLAALRARPPGS
jgi:hypothetical protein